jgi:hypothetical protein
MSPLPASPGSPLAAYTALGASLTAIVILAGLHLLRRDLAPGSTMVSQYAVGPHGWIMGACFAAWSVGSFALFVALIGQRPGILGWIGLVLLLAAAVGQAMGGLFPMDPAGTAPEAMSQTGRLHGVGFTIGVPGQLLGALVLTIALGRQAAWDGWTLGALTGVMWVSTIVMAVSLMGAMQNPDTMANAIFGWPNRLLMVAYSVWTAVAAWPLVSDRIQ